MRDVLPELQEVFRDVLDDPTLQIDRHSGTTNVRGWDSLAHVTLLAAIQQQFGIRIAVGEIAQLTDVGAILDLLERKRAQP